MTATLGALAAGARRTLSFEFFPPKTDDGVRRLWQAVEDLEPLAPDFVSVTYGAGGTTRDRTLGIVRRILAETDLRPVMHLTCVGADTAALRALASEAQAAGIRDVLALRGDPPAGPGGRWTATPGGLRYAADLVRLLRSVGSFSVGVAAFPEGHPESPDLDTDARHLAAKCAAGADYAITQFFFDVDRYRDLVARARAVGCDTPIIPGVMPVTDPPRIRRFAALAGATIPAGLDARFRAVEDDPAAVHALGVRVATDLARDLLAAGAPGLHFYTLNRSAAVREVCAALRADGAWRGVGHVTSRA